MKSYRKELVIHYPRRRGYLNLTPQVEAALAESGIREGLLLCNAMHTGEGRGVGRVEVIVDLFPILRIL